jgi:hypothetical protein
MTTADGLYGLPLDRFVPERAALAKSLRGEGKRDEAARVGKLPKPSVAAWAVNQLIRTQPRGAEALFEAGDALIEAQSDLVAGSGDAATLRQATQRERAAVDDLAGAARGLLGSAGNEMSHATLERVTDTLHAAALDEDARARVRDGCLDRELRRAGFAGGVASPPSPPSGGGTRKAREPGPARKGVDQTASESRGAAAAKRDREAEREAERRRAEQLKAARKAEADTRRRAERAARELSAAQERRDRAADALRGAEDALAGAGSAAADAARALRDAQDELERI